MRFQIEFRNAFSDVHVTDWKVVSEWGLHPTPLAAYNSLCENAGVILDVVGFVDAPEWGRIRTDPAYGEHTLFQYPPNSQLGEKPFEKVWQYRIVPAPEQLQGSKNDESREVMV